MKLPKSAIVKFNQRELAWKNLKLGTSNLTIGDAGCTITCIAMIAGITPSEVNTRLVAHGGYAQKNLVIWSKIKDAMPWLEFKWRGYTYDNDKVKEIIERNGFCLVEVDWDGSLKTTGKHWVLFTGDQRMIDPWTGNEVRTRKYTIKTGYAEIELSSNEPDVIPTSVEGKPRVATAKDWMKEIVVKNDHIGKLEGQVSGLLKERLKSESNIAEAFNKGIAQGRIIAAEASKEDMRDLKILKDGLFPLGIEFGLDEIEVSEALEAYHLERELDKKVEKQLSTSKLTKSWNSLPAPFKVSIYLSASSMLAQILVELNAVDTKSAILVAGINIAIVGVKSVLGYVKSLSNTK